MATLSASFGSGETNAEVSSSRFYPVAPRHALPSLLLLLVRRELLLAPDHTAQDRGGRRRACAELHEELQHLHVLVDRTRPETLDTRSREARLSVATRQVAPFYLRFGLGDLPGLLLLRGIDDREHVDVIRALVVIVRERPDQ